MGTRIATTACSTLLALSAAGCSSTAGEKLDPVTVMKAAESPGDGWSADPQSPGDPDNGPRYEELGGAVSRLDPKNVDENQVFPKGEVIAAWSIKVTEKNLDQVCGEFASWTLATIKGSPGKPAKSDGPVPTTDQVVSECLKAGDSTKDESGGAIDYGLPSHVASKADGYSYATTPSMVLSSTGRKLIASFVARTPSD